MRKAKEFDSKNTTAILSYIDYLSKDDCIILIGIAEDDITKPQKASANLYCKLISDEFNNLGITHSEVSVTGKNLESPYTQEIVRRTIWNPTQQMLYNSTSLRELKKDEITDIALTIEQYLLQYKSILVVFPSIENVFDKLMEICEKSEKTKEDLIKMQKYRMILNRKRSERKMTLKDFCKKHNINISDYENCIK